MVRKAVGESDVSGTLLGCSDDGRTSFFTGCTTGKAETGAGGAYSVRGCGWVGAMRERLELIPLKLRGPYLYDVRNEGEGVEVLTCFAFIKYW